MRAVADAMPTPVTASLLMLLLVQTRRNSCCVQEPRPELEALDRYSETGNILQ